uniref:DUF1618 domain-containing protein n=1 Tax=Oryza glumipatula TaxID=40148 RepID=A0A0E0B6R7_9ORYZ
MAQMGIMYASLYPPVHGRSLGKRKRRQRRMPRWVLLDKLAYFSDADVRNATTATSKTREGHEIQVTLCTAARPPLVSYVCIHSPTLNPKTDDFAMEPQIIAAHDDLLLIRLILGIGNRFTVSLADYFVYQAASIDDDIPPSLTRITHPGPMITFTNHEVTILHNIPEAQDIDEPLISNKQHYIITTLSPAATPRNIPLPPPLKQGKVISGADPKDVRDIAVDLQGHINFVELEVDALRHKTDRTGYISQDWTVAKWSCCINSESDDCLWHMDYKLNASDISHLMPPQLPNYCHPTKPSPTLERLHVGHPLLSLDNNGMAKVDHRDYKAWVIPVDMRKRLIHEPAVFEGAPRTLGISHTYIQTTISNYLQPVPGHR